MLLHVVYNGMLCTLQNYNAVGLLGSRGNSRIVAAFVRKVLDAATRRDGNGKASKVQASIGQYIVLQQHAGRNAHE